MEQKAEHGNAYGQDENDAEEVTEVSSRPLPLAQQRKLTGKKFHGGSMPRAALLSKSRQKAAAPFFGAAACLFAGCASQGGSVIPPERNRA